MTNPDDHALYVENSKLLADNAALCVCVCAVWFFSFCLLLFFFLKKMPRKKSQGAHCFICGVIPSSKENPGAKVAIFNATKERHPAWEKVIRKPGLQIGSRLCALHFDIADVITGKEIGGTFHAYPVCRLKEHAIPKHYLGKSFFHCKPFFFHYRSCAYNLIEIAFLKR